MANEIIKKVIDVFTINKNGDITFLYKNGRNCLCPHAPLMPVQKGLVDSKTGQTQMEFQQMPCNDTCPKFKRVEGRSRETGDLLYKAVAICDNTINILTETETKLPS